jgi:hypothetical protein
VDGRAAFVAQREAAEAMQPCQVGSTTQRKTPRPLPMSLRDFHKRSPPSFLVMTL